MIVLNIIYYLWGMAKKTFITLFFQEMHKSNIRNCFSFNTKNLLPSLSFLCENNATCNFLCFIRYQPHMVVIYYIYTRQKYCWSVRLNLAQMFQICSDEALQQVLLQKIIDYITMEQFFKTSLQNKTKYR